MQTTPSPARNLRRLLGPFAIAAILTFAVAACSGGDDDASPTAPATGSISTATAVVEATSTTAPATSTPGASPTPAPSPTPGNDAGPDIEYNGFELFGDFQYADPIDFPENLAVIVSTGCTRCDGPTEALYRVWRNGGEAHSDLLIDASISDHEDAYITSFALRPDFSEIIVGVCTAGDCARIDTPDPAAQITFYQSIDGGASWDDLFIAAPGVHTQVVAVTAEGIVLSDGPDDLHLYGGDDIEPPADGEFLAFGAANAGELRWLTADGNVLLGPDGRKLAEVEPGSQIFWMATGTSGSSRPVISWASPPPGPGFTGWNLTQPREDFKHIGFHSEDLIAPIAVLRDASVLGYMPADDTATGGTAGFIDVRRGVLTPIHGPFLDAPFGDGLQVIDRTQLAGAIEGPFLRVTAGPDCLSIRADTTTQAQELACPAPGALVHDLHNTVTVGGEEWTRVRLLDGREGFAISQRLSAD